MKRKQTNSHVEQLIEKLGKCLAPDSVTSAKKLLAIKLKSPTKARINYLAAGCDEGELTPEESWEYRSCIAIEAMISSLKTKSRQLLSCAKAK